MHQRARFRSLRRRSGTGESDGETGGADGGEEAHFVEAGVKEWNGDNDDE